jgi:4-amino-4-deoxy-L-arabinose transferase-like glycosyltransferase
MGFDDRKTEPLVVVGCLALVCGLAAPAAWRLFGWGCGVAALATPVVIWLLLEWGWRCEDRDRPGKSAE